MIRLKGHRRVQPSNLAKGARRDAKSAGLRVAAMLPPQLFKALQSRAKANGMSMSYTIAEICRDHLTLQPEVVAPEVEGDISARRDEIAVLKVGLAGLETRLAAVDRHLGL